MLSIWTSLKICSLVKGWKEFDTLIVEIILECIQYTASLNIYFVCVEDYLQFTIAADAS